LTENGYSAFNSDTPVLCAFNLRYNLHVSDEYCFHHWLGSIGRILRYKKLRILKDIKL